MPVSLIRCDFVRFYKSIYVIITYMEFKLTNHITYHMSGKFIADSDQWTHYTRSLTDYELMVVTKGTLFIEDEKQRYTVNEGEYLLMSPCKIQKGFKNSRCSFYWLHVWHNNTESGTANISIPVQSKLQNLERIIILLKQLQDSDKRYHNEKLNSILAQAIFAEIEQQVSFNTHESSIYSQDHLLEEIKEYVKWHLQENIKVWQIARYFGYNEKYLTTLFHSTTGTALKQYILQSKMEQAKIQLTDKTTQIAQIAYNLAFEDSHNFSNAFKKVTGLSPKAYRENYGKEKINREK